MFPDETNFNDKQKKSSLGKILGAFFCIITLRVFLDSYAYTFTSGYLFSWEHYLHSLLYFSSIFLSFTLLLFFLTKENFRDILSFLSRVSLVILLVPLIDLAINRVRIQSLYVTVTNNDLAGIFLKLINPFNDLGVTKGIYFSAYLTLVMFFFFTYKKTRSLSKGFVSVFLGFSIFFVYSILPSTILLYSHSVRSGIQSDFAYIFTLKQSWLGKYFALDSNNLENISSSMNVLYEIVMTRLYWLFTFFQSAAIFFLSNKPAWNSFIRNSRIERITNYSLIAIIGILLGEKISGDINISNSINVITLLCFFILIPLNAWLAAFVNDSEDTKIDKISNPERPLVDKAISQKEWRALHKYISLFLLLGLFLLDKQVSFLLVLAQCAFYIYSAHPLRLKRHFISSSVLIGFTTVVISMSGFFLVSPDLHLMAFPIKAALIIGISYALLSNIKDIKDYAGDKAEKIMTIPVTFGLEKSKIIIAFLYALVFMSLPVFLSLNALIPFAIAASIFVFYILTRKNYQEKYVFYTKFAYMIVLYFLTR